MSDNIITITDENFEQQVLNETQAVLIDFWAEWCGPCRTIKPILEEIAQLYQDKLKVGKINIDPNPKTPQKYGVRGVPTLMLFKGGELEATKVGAMSKSQLTAFLDSNL
jgi:thioredoxin 1